MGHGPLAIWYHRHLFPVLGAAAQGFVDGPLFIPQPPQHHRFIFPVEGVIGKLLRQCPMSAVVFCNDQKAAGVLVDAVDDAGAQFPADARKAVAAVVEQGVDQGTLDVYKRQPQGIPRWKVPS